MEGAEALQEGFQAAKAAEEEEAVRLEHLTQTHGADRIDQIDHLDPNLQI